MTTNDILRQIRHCSAWARRELYMRSDRDQADAWARAAMDWQVKLWLRLYRRI